MDRRDKLKVVHWFFKIRKGNIEQYNFKVRYVDIERRASISNSNEK